jgi:hypothetical protein
MSRAAAEWTVLYGVMVASLYAFARAVIVREWRCARQCPVAWFAVRWFRRPPYLHMFAFLAMTMGVSAAAIVLKEVLTALDHGKSHSLLAWFLITVPWPMLKEEAQLALILVVVAWIGGLFWHNRDGLLRDLSTTPVTVQDAASPFIVRVAVAFTLASASSAAVSLGGLIPWIAVTDMLLAAACAFLILGLAVSFAVCGWNPFVVIGAVAATYALYVAVFAWTALPGIVALLRLDPQSPAVKALSVPVLTGIAWAHYRSYRRTRARHTPAEAG